MCTKSFAVVPAVMSALISLWKFGLPLGFVGALLLALVERVIYPRCRIRLFLGKQLVQAFRRRAEGATSVPPLGRRISLVEYVVDAAVDEGVLWLKLVVLIHAVFACRRFHRAIRSSHDSTMSLHQGSAMVRVRDRTLRLLQIQPKTITDVRYTGKPAAKSAVARLRTTCSGVCLFLVAIVIEPSCPHRGRQDSHSTCSTWINEPGSWQGPLALVGVMPATAW